MFEIAKKYHSQGLSVIAISNAEKQPIGAWKKNQKALLPPDENFNAAYGIGIVCGAVSGNVEVVDIDLKHDLSGNLWDRYKKLVGSPLLKKLVIEKTPSGGFHLIYRCEEIQGNQKLAMRHTTFEEQQANVHRKQETLIETRGQGGYFMCAPSPGYEIMNGSFEDVPKITKEERNTLLECGRALNDIVPVHHPTSKAYYQQQNSPFEDFNNRGDIGEVLSRNGWEFVTDSGDRLMYKRPGSDNKWSATVHKIMRLLYVFTSSSVFEPSRAYNASTVLCKLEFNEDWSTCASYLRNKGYGQPKNITEGKEKGTYTAPITSDSTMDYLTKARNGTLAMGLALNVKDLDDYWRAKRKHLVCLNGLDNTGKSQVAWYLSLLLAVKHKWKTIIHPGENSVGNVTRKLIEFKNNLPIDKISEDKFYESVKWVDENFKIIAKKGIYTYKNLLDIGSQELEEKKYDIMLIDPYNSLYRDKKHNENDHSYDYDALGDMRQWIEDKDCCIYLTCHAATDAARRVHQRGHRFEGLPMPPGKADTEGGQKFANRTDDFLTVHRYAQSKEEWMWTEIHTRKIKETETGGKITYIDNPVKLKMNLYQCGFTDEYGYDPVTGIQVDVDKRTDSKMSKQISEALNNNDHGEQDEYPF